MAKTTRTCPACNEATITFTARSRKEVERYADYKIEQGRICDACLAKQREEENARAAQANDAAGLPALQGTEKQIAWAETLRAELLGFASGLATATQQLIDGDLEAARTTYAKLPVTWQPRDTDFAALDIRADDRECTGEATLVACRVLRQQRDAGWWVDHRGMTFAQLLKALRQPILDAMQGAPEPEELVEEVAIKPASPVTTVVAEVELSERAVSVRLPERCDDFRAVVHPLGYRWASPSRTWRLSLGPTLGDPEDRAAEVTHRLLEAGFIVSCQRTVVRDKALAARYEPVYPRWVAFMTKGRFADWMQITVRDGHVIHDELVRMGAKVDYYRAGTWYVRPGHYAVLRDLAEIHGFRLTPEADKALDKAKRADEARLLAEELPEAPHATAEMREPGQHIPDGIDPELKDD